MDARSYAAAVGNRARGGGVECPEYYPNAEITFMNLANIHTIRQSHQKLLFIKEGSQHKTPTERETFSKNESKVKVKTTCRS